MSETATFDFIWKTYLASKQYENRTFIRKSSLFSLLQKQRRIFTLLLQIIERDKVSVKSCQPTYDYK